MDPLNSIFFFLDIKFISKLFAYSGFNSVFGTIILPGSESKIFTTSSKLGERNPLE